MFAKHNLQGGWRCALCIQW